MLQNSRTFKMSVTLYRECLKVRLPNHLRDQMDRASSSISLNIAEGYGKSTYRDQRKFFHIAMGSLREVQSVLILAEAESTLAYTHADQLGGSLYRLIHAKPAP
ncbi:MAG: four helix bundle protein [Bdellovibrionales bacterium]|jgi:four helix bundle protein|nr:four helix bundle protein [Bdellovibrionales bacterium]MBT3526672.1 four helix bundle protein [Bdellovibrionales bacterium]